MCTAQSQKRVFLCLHLPPYPLLLSPVCCKVINRDFHTLALLEFAQYVCQQIKVKGIGVVKVVVVAGGQNLLFCCEDLRTNIATTLK